MRFFFLHESIDNFDKNKASQIAKSGAEIIVCDDKNGRVDLKKLIKILGNMQIDSVLLEGGAELNFSALKSGIVNRLDLYIGAQIFGGQSKSPVGGAGIDKVSDSFKLKKRDTLDFGDDILISYDVELI